MNESESAPLIRRIEALSTPLLPQATGVTPRLPRLEGIRVLVFDIYGTLLISASGDIGLGGDRNETQAFAAALQAAGLKLENPEQLEHGPLLLKEVIREHHRERRAEGVEYPEVDILAVWSRVLERLGLSLDTAALQSLAVEYECRVNPVWPMPGLAQLLSGLRRAGLRMGIVSNAQFCTPLMIQALLGKHPYELGFTPEYCAWSHRLLEAKPSTRLYEQCLAALAEREGIAPREVLYVGNDQLKDIWPASASGCRTALFAGDARSLRLREDDQRCNGVTPDAVVTELSQLGELLAVRLEPE